MLGNAEELDHRRFQAAVGGNLHPHQSLGAHLLGPVGQTIKLVATHFLGLARRVDALDAFGAAKGLEFGPGKNVGQFGQFHRETQVGFVNPEPVHRIAPGHLLDRGNDFAGDGFGCRGNC